MSTEVQSTKLGLKLTCVTNKRALPKSVQAYPLPELGADQIQPITASLSADLQGVPGLRIQTIDPSGLSGKLAWKLEQAAYVGTRPDALTWKSAGVPSGPLNLWIGTPDAGCTYLFRLVSTNAAGLTTTSGEVAVAVPDSAAVAIKAKDLDPICDDGVLSTAEKPAVITAYNAAASDYAIFSARAAGAGLAYLEFSAAWNALTEYLLALNPAYDNTALDTTINATTWQACWHGFNAAKASLLVRLAGLPPTVVQGVTTTNQNLTTNASAPSIDGVQRSVGNLVFLAGQTTPAENGVYTICYTGTQSEFNAWPTGGSYTSGGTGSSYSNDANAYDNSGSPSYTPNDATVATLASPDYLTGTSQVIYSGWSGSWTSCTLKINLGVSCNNEGGEASSVVAVSYSLDAGQHWTEWDSFDVSSNGDHALSISISGVTPANLRVRVQCISISDRYWDRELQQWILILTGPATATIKSVYAYCSSVSSENWYFTKAFDVTDGSSWRVESGTTYGCKTISAAVASDNSITLTQTTVYSQDYDRVATCAGRPAAAQKLMIFQAPRGFRVMATGHQGKCYTNPASTATLTLKKNGTSFGTLQFASNGTFSIVSVTQTDFLVGDILTIEAPSSQDSMFADIGITLRAVTL